MSRTLRPWFDGDDFMIEVNWSYESGTNDEFNRMIMQDYWGMIDTCKEYGEKGVDWSENPGGLNCVFTFKSRQHAVMFKLVWS